MNGHTAPNIEQQSIHTRRRGIRQVDLILNPKLWQPFVTNPLDQESNSRKNFCKGTEKLRGYTVLGDIFQSCRYPGHLQCFAFFEFWRGSRIVYNDSKMSIKEIIYTTCLIILTESFSLIQEFI